MNWAVLAAITLILKAKDPVNVFQMRLIILTSDLERALHYTVSYIQSCNNYHVENASADQWKVNLVINFSFTSIIKCKHLKRQVRSFNTILTCMPFSMILVEVGISELWVRTDEFTRPRHLSDIGAEGSVFESQRILKLTRLPFLTVKGKPKMLSFSLICERIEASIAEIFSAMLSSVNFVRQHASPEVAPLPAKTICSLLFWSWVNNCTIYENEPRIKLSW